MQIDLLDLLHRLCGQWKRIAACAVLCAVLAGAGSFALGKNGTAEDLPVEQEEAAAEPEPVPLTQEERVQGVEAARQLALETKELEAYVSGSVLMQIDPYHKNSVQMAFRIEGTTGWTMQKIMEKYLSFLGSDAAVDAIQKKDQGLAEIEACYLSELYFASQKTSGTYLDAEGNTLSGVLLSVETTGQDAAMAASLAQGIQAVLEDYHSTVEKECGRHLLELLDSQEKERADSTLFAQQQEKRADLAAGRANLKAAVDAFDDEQKAMYAAAESENIGTGQKPEKQTGWEADLEPEKQADLNAEMEPEKQAVLDAEPERLADTDVQEEPQPEGEADVEAERSVSVVYVLLGFLGGILAYSAAYSCWYLMRDTVKSAGEFRSYYTFPFFGTIGLGLPDQNKGSAGQEQVLNRVRLSCRKQEVAGFCLAADFSPNEEERACIEGMVSRLREWGLDVVFAENTADSTAVWDMLVEAGTVLMLCRLGSTTHQMVDDAMEFYLESGVSVLGAAALE